jgi:N-acetylglutamate synthase-like GNAT family acetyltransferase
VQTFSLRPANNADAAAIKRLIYQVGINPLGLHWQNFILAIDEQGQMIGCGQIKRHFDSSRELASIAVVLGWRGRGVATAIIQELIRKENGVLYLTCRTGLTPFYQRFGFEPAKYTELPPYFRRIYHLSGVLQRAKWAPAEGLAILIRRGVSSKPEF